MKKQALRPAAVDALALQGKSVKLVVARWHIDITTELETAAIAQLRLHGIRDICVHQVPGCFELPLAAQLVARPEKVDAVVALGCVIRGETPHFEYICQACCNGLLQVSLQQSKPVGFGVITANSTAEAKARSSTHNNKGQEAANAVAEMLSQIHSFSKT